MAAPALAPIRVALFVVLATPFAWLGWAIGRELIAPGSVLGADPGEAVVEYLGSWGIRVLLLTLAVSPLRRLTGATWLIRLRRMIGLFAFAYLASHFVTYLWFFTEFDWALVGEEIGERPYITVGFAALVILFTLAITSTAGWQRRLRRNWQRLHRGIYIATALGLIHLLWLTRDGYFEFALYLAIAVALGFERLVAARRAQVLRTGR
jgi:sulfoxide reductase heme-binding subunit YedZ